MFQTTPFFLYLFALHADLDVETSKPPTREGSCPCKGQLGMIYHDLPSKFHHRVYPSYISHDNGFFSQTYFPSK